MLLISAIILAVLNNDANFVNTAEIRTENNVSGHVYDTIVVGLGAAGCAALGKLSRRGRAVLGLEGTRRVGGRVHTEPFGHGLVELGAEWIHGTNHSVTYELAVANNITVGNQDGVSRVFRSDGTELGKELVKDLLENCMDDTNITNKEQSSAEYYTQTCIDYMTKNKPELAKDQKFVAEWINFFSYYVVAADAADDWKDVTTISSYEDLDEYLLTSWHKHGYKTLFEILLNTYNNGPGLPSADIKLNKHVTQIEWPQEPAADVVVKCADGSEYRARHVIVTVSLGVLKHSYKTLFTPPLPAPSVEAVNSISMGLIGKIILSFEKRWWSDDDLLFGFMWSKEDKEMVPEDDAWTANVTCTSTSMGADNVLVMWTHGATARHVETLSDEVVKEKVMKLLRRFMGPNVPEATGIIKTNWYSNPFTRGTYTYDNLDTPKHPHIREQLRQPLLDAAGQPRVLIAGEATNTPHYGTVHGAVETGIREANRLLGENTIALY